MPILSEKCPGTTSIESGQLFENRSHCHDGDSSSIRELKVEPKIEHDTKKTPLTHPNIYNHHVEESNAQKSPSTNLISARRKRHAEIFPPVSRTLPDFDQVLRDNKVLSHLEVENIRPRLCISSMATMLFCSRQICLAI